MLDGQDEKGGGIAERGSKGLEGTAWFSMHMRHCRFVAFLGGSSPTLLLHHHQLVAGGKLQGRNILQTQPTLRHLSWQTPQPGSRRGLSTLRGTRQPARCPGQGRPCYATEQSPDDHAESIVDRRSQQVCETAQKQGRLQFHWGCPVARVLVCVCVCVCVGVGVGVGVGVRVRVSVRVRVDVCARACACTGSGQKSRATTHRQPRRVLILDGFKNPRDAIARGFRPVDNADAHLHSRVYVR
jgi:hypothetical protein